MANYKKNEDYYEVVYPALTTDMLLEILPNITIIKGKKYTVEHELGEFEPLTCYEDKSLPNALSLMVKYLRDSGT